MGAFFLMLLIVADAIPQALTSIPVFGIYLFTNMGVVLLTMVFSVIVAAINECSEEKAMPKCLTKVCKIFYTF